MSDAAYRKKLRQKQSELYPDMVYFLNDATPNVFKIGWATNFYRRVRDLQTGNPRQLILAHYITCNKVRSLEIAIHSLLEERRYRGEWFDLDGIVLEDLCSQLSPTYPSIKLFEDVNHDPFSKSE